MSHRRRTVRHSEQRGRKSPENAPDVSFDARPDPVGSLGKGVGSLSTSSAYGNPEFSNGRNWRGVFSLQRDRFNPLDFFGGECELFGLEVFFHMLLARGSGQREHPDLHGKPKDDLCGTGT